MSLLNEKLLNEDRNDDQIHQIQDHQIQTEDYQIHQIQDQTEDYQIHQIQDQTQDQAQDYQTQDQNKIAICLNCYYKSNISKLILQLSSLLMKMKSKIQHPNLLENIEFKTINECINYLKSQGFEEVKNKNIHVALYCDGLSGQVYKDIYDFKNRIDISDFNNIFKDKVFKIDYSTNSDNYIKLNLKSLPYFIYNLSPEVFPDITNKINEFINTRSKTDIDLQLKLFRNKFHCDHEISKLIFDNLNISESDIIIFYYIYDNFFRNADYSKQIQELLNSNEKFKKYTLGFKITYSVFIELYLLQPELFDKYIEDYYFNEFNNDYIENIDEIKRIFNEFHNKYPNSSLQGTYYHTNLMINRTRFLNDYDSSFKFFIDDDDFTGGLDNYYSIYEWYIKNVKIDYSELNKIIKYIDPKLMIKPRKIMKKSVNIFENEQRKLIRAIIENNINTPLGRYLYITFMKYCVYKFNVWNGESIQNNLCALWNDIIPPYLPLNFLNVQETRCEDSSFNALHFANNYINNDYIVYYYNSPSLHNYDREKNFIVELKIRSIYNYLHKNELSYFKLKHGRWFYSLNDEIEFISKDEIIKTCICNYNDLNKIE